MPALKLPFLLAYKGCAPLLVDIVLLVILIFIVVWLELLTLSLLELLYKSETLHEYSFNYKVLSWKSSNYLKKQLEADYMNF